jgi:ADP-heptose:LPS heptosyltransferase
MSKEKPFQPASPDFKRVLIIKFGGLSSFVQSLAAARIIREFHFGARITLLTTDEFKAFAEKCPYFDVVETTQPTASDPKQIATVISRIRKSKFDIVYDLECTSRTSSYYLGLKPWPPRWSGVATNCSHLHDNPERDQMHPLDRFADQIAHAGLGPRAGSLGGWPIGAAPLPDLSWARSALRDPPRLQPEFFGLKRPFILLAPAASPELMPEHWPVERYIAFARQMLQRGVMTAVVGGPPERDFAAAIVKAEPKTKNLVSRTDLFQLAALAERAAACVGSDSGAMHVAAAAGAPCVVLYSAEQETALVAPRGRAGVLKLLAPYLGDLPVEDVIRAVGNLGAFASSTAKADA